MRGLLVLTAFGILPTASGQNFPDIAKWMDAALPLLKYADHLMGPPDWETELPVAVKRMRLQIRATTNTSRLRELESDLKSILDYLPDIPLDFIDVRPLRAELIAAHGEAIRKLSDPASFGDVPNDHWAKAAVDQLAEDRLLAGYPDETTCYRPLDPDYRPLTDFAPNYKSRVESRQDKARVLLEALKNLESRFAKSRGIDRNRIATHLKQVKRLAPCFEKELHQLGVDSAATISRIRKLLDHPN